jgi:hypothetical protein
VSELELDPDRGLASLYGPGTPAPWEQLEPLNKWTNALAASLVVKTGPGRLYNLTVFNSNAAAQFILLFDAVALPANGTAACTVLKVATVASQVFNWNPGRVFLTGIVVVNSSTEPTLTVGAADCFYDAQFL